MLLKLKLIYYSILKSVKCHAGPYMSKMLFGQKYKLKMHKLKNAQEKKISEK